MKRKTVNGDHGPGSKRQKINNQGEMGDFNLVFFVMQYLKIFLDFKSLLALSHCCKTLEAFLIPENDLLERRMEMSLNVRWTKELLNAPAKSGLVMKFNNKFKPGTVNLVDHKGYTNFERLKDASALVITRTCRRLQPQRYSLKDFRGLRELNLKGSISGVLQVLGLRHFGFDKSECSDYVDLSKFDSRFLKALTLDGAEISDLAPLELITSLEIISLHNLPRITDVSALGKVLTLTLDRMSGVTDVSDLSSVRTLTLRHMCGVTDVSALSSVQTLTLWGMSGVTDVSALSSVHTLTLREMYEVRDVSVLSSVHTLTLVK
jgi:hypothetical protein